MRSSSLAGIVALAALSSAEAGERTLVGYASELTARPGAAVEFMVSSFSGRPYTADLVRVINGDSQSRYREQFRVEEIDAPFAGTYQGVHQPLNLGSYLHVDDTRPLRDGRSFTLSAYIFPTFLPGRGEEHGDPFSPPTPSIADRIAVQTIVSRYDKTTSRGWALQIDEEGHLTYRGREEQGTLRKLRLPEPVRDRVWARVVVTYDHKTGEVQLLLREAPLSPGDKFTARESRVDGVWTPPIVDEGPLRVGAVRDGPGAAAARFEKPGDVFNGRIQDVRMAKRVLLDREIEELASEKTPNILNDDLFLDYDFGRRIGKSSAQDLSPTRLHGELVNLPETGVRGRFWDHATLDWRRDRDSYDAIHFHADDLYDAEWKAAFAYEVPQDLESGIYAARLRDRDFTEYVPFFVVPPDTVATADLAVWLSEYSYLAYSNVSLVVTARDQYPGHNFNEADGRFLAAHAEYATGGVHNRHVDGTYFTYGSRLRPDLHMKPGGLVYNFVQDTHIVSFLEHEGIEYDVITDELVHEGGEDLLSRYRVVVSSTHPEYATPRQFDSIGRYLEEGGRFLYLGGNGWFWSVAPHPNRPAAIESRNRADWSERFLQDGTRGGAMAETGRSSAALVGMETAGMVFHGSGHYRKTPGAANPRAAFLFEGVAGETFGDYGVDRVRGGAAGFKVDRANFDAGTPRHALIVARSDALPPTTEDVRLGNVPPGIGYPSGRRRPAAEAVFFETPRGGAVFSTGSIAWISSTLENDFDNDVARITRNALRRFLDPAPFPELPRNP